MSHFADKIPRLNYSGGLHQHLKGLDPINCDSYNGTDNYTWIAFWSISIAFLLMLNFYYLLFNRPKLGSRWMWFANVITAGVIAFLVAYTRAEYDLVHGNYCKDLSFNITDCSLLGLMSGGYTMFLCVLFTAVMKWWSLNNNKYPV